MGFKKLHNDQVKKVDHFLNWAYKKHGDFGWDFFEEYEKDYGEIYDLVNHHAFVVEMYITAPTHLTHEARKKIERFRFTHRGNLSYMFDGGYAE
ncbi:MAG TPA: hypothetical protein VFD56_03105, partial [Chitinophagaceae bacterium]|nr:hypothetical protein [Chitinophagaceae bacterium]